MLDIDLAADNDEIPYLGYSKDKVTFTYKKNDKK